MIWRGEVIRDYDAAGLEKFEVCVADGVITASMGQLPDDLTAYQARVVAEMLMVAANALEPPEQVYDFSNAERGAVLSPVGKTRIAFYLDDDVLDSLRKVATAAGRGYQAIVNTTMRDAMRKALEEGSNGRSICKN